MRIPIKRFSQISRGEHLQEVPISTFLPKNGEPLVCIHRYFQSLDYPIREMDNLE
jgi:hypothetical protein